AGVGARVGAAGGAGEAADVGDRGRLYGGACPLDRHLPAVTGDVPEQLVVGVEAVQCPRHPVGEDVRVRADDDLVRVTDPPHHEVAGLLAVEVVRRVRTGLHADPADVVDPDPVGVDRHPERDLPVDAV